MRLRKLSDRASFIMLHVFAVSLVGLSSLVFLNLDENGKYPGGAAFKQEVLDSISPLRDSELNKTRTQPKTVIDTVVEFLKGDGFLKIEPVHSKGYDKRPIGVGGGRALGNTVYDKLDDNRKSMGSDSDSR